MENSRGFSGARNRPQLPEVLISAADRLAAGRALEHIVSGDYDDEAMDQAIARAQQPREEER